VCVCVCVWWEGEEGIGYFLWQRLCHALPSYLCHCFFTPFGVLYFTWFIHQTWPNISLSRAYGTEELLH